MAMRAQDRLSALLEVIGERGSVSIAEAAASLKVSEATARRDVVALAKERLVLRTHGGAAALGSGYELPIQYKIAREADAKVVIAEAAARLVASSETVGLNGGTTTSAVARELGRAEHLRTGGADIGVTVVTNAVNIAYELSVRADVRIIVTGGVARRQSYELVGHRVAESLAEYSLDTVILGVDGLSADFGFTTVDEGEAQVSRDFMRIARRVVVVADATKLGRATFARICALDAVDVLVTNAAVTGALRDALDLAGVDIVVAT
jgi:DeoR family transcriptional regulator, aga operon transcriptional repressor